MEIGGGMATAQLSVTIARPLEEVFAVLTDVEKTHIWSAPAVEEHWTTPPPYGIGSRRHAIAQMMGRRTENDAEVTAYELNRRWEMKSVSGPGFVVSAEFSPVTGGTRVDWTWILDFHGPMRLVERPATWVFGRLFAKDLVRLKKLMEAGSL
jgi:uncharacterized protein YndB with AHSA1/START domain